MQPDYFYESAPGDRMLYMPRPAARSSPTDNYQLHFSYICNRVSNYLYAHVKVNLLCGMKDCTLNLVKCYRLFVLHLLLQQLT